MKMCLNAVRWKVLDWILLTQDGDSFGEGGNEHSFCMKCGDFCNYLKVCCYLERYVVQDKTGKLIYSNKGTLFYRCISFISLTFIGIAR